MIFKNHRGEVPWYVIGLILAIIVLLVSIGAISKIRAAQKQTGEVTQGCTGFGGTCKTACSTNEDSIALGKITCSPGESCCRPKTT
jgi:hypothetical protein